MKNAAPLSIAWCLATALFFVSQPLRAQLWIDAGLKGAYGLTMLYNSNIFDDGHYNYHLNTGYGFGGKIGVNFGEHHGIALEGLRTFHQQEWDYTTALSDTENRNLLQWDNWDLYALYRYYSQQAYIELGGKYSLVQHVSQKDDNLPDIEVDNFYVKNYPSATFGFGGFLGGSDFFSVVLGIRIDYALGDFISETGQTFLYPNPVRSNVYPAYKLSRPLSAQVSLSVDFAIGEYAKARCGERVFLFFPNRY